MYDMDRDHQPCGILNILGIVLVLDLLEELYTQAAVGREVMDPTIPKSLLVSLPMETEE